MHTARCYLWWAPGNRIIPSQPYYPATNTPNAGTCPRSNGRLSTNPLHYLHFTTFYNFQDRECREAAKRYERMHPTHHTIYIIIIKTLLVWAGGTMLKHCHLTPRIYTCVDSTRLWVLYVCTDVTYHACLQHTPVSSPRDNPKVSVISN